MVRKMLEEIILTQVSGHSHKIRIKVIISANFNYAHAGSEFSQSKHGARIMELVPSAGNQRTHYYYVFGSYAGADLGGRPGRSMLSFPSPPLFFLTKTEPHWPRRWDVSFHEYKLNVRLRESSPPPHPLWILHLERYYVITASIVTLMFCVFWKLTIQRLDMRNSSIYME